MEERKLELWSKKVNFLKGLIEIVAIVSAGAWAVWLFWIKEIPLFEKNFVVTPTLKFEDYDSTHCLVTASIQTENFGRQIVYVKKISGHFYLIPTDSILEGRHFQIEQFIQKQLKLGSSMNSEQKVQNGSQRSSASMDEFKNQAPDSKQIKSLPFLAPKDKKKSVVGVWHIYIENQEEPIAKYVWKIGSVLD